VTEPTNLKRFRKRKARAEDARAADANRVREGVSKAARNAAAAEESRRSKLLAGAKRESADGSAQPVERKGARDQLDRDPRPKGK
jgi:hypothetical protein